MNRNRMISAFCVTGLCAAMLAAAYAQDEPKQDAPAATTEAAATPAADKPKSLGEKISYGIGMNMGRNLAQQFPKPELLDAKMLAAGLTDALKGMKPRLTAEEFQAALTVLQKEMQAGAAAAEAQAAAAAGENKKAGEAYLAANKTKEGVKTTASGLQYKIVKEGKGAKPKATDTVRVHYRGKLIDGTEFDSSYKRGEPAVFAVNRVIPGWTEVVQMMPVGSTWKVFIPSELAYGDRSVGPVIKPGSTLVFDIELLGIEEADGN